MNYRQARKIRTQDADDMLAGRGTRHTRQQEISALLRIRRRDRALARKEYSAWMAFKSGVDNGTTSAGIPQDITRIAASAMVDTLRRCNQTVPALMLDVMLNSYYKL